MDNVTRQTQLKTHTLRRSFVSAAENSKAKIKNRSVSMAFCDFRRIRLLQQIVSKMNTFTENIRLKDHEFMKKGPQKYYELWTLKSQLRKRHDRLKYYNEDGCVKVDITSCDKSLRILRLSPTTFPLSSVYKGPTSFSFVPLESS